MTSTILVAKFYDIRLLLIRYSAWLKNYALGLCCGGVIADAYLERDNQHDLPQKIPLWAVMCMYVIYVNLYFVLCLKVTWFTQVGEKGHNKISANIKYYRLYNFLS